MINLFIFCVIVLIIFLIIKYNDKQQRDLKEKIQQEEENRRNILTEKKQQKKERKEAERKRIEELKYEKVNVVFATIDTDDKPIAIIKRLDNTYHTIKRQNTTPFVFNEILKLKRDLTEKWNWHNVEGYKKYLSKFQEIDKIIQQKLKNKNKKNEILDRFDIQYLYHMTHIDNLNSILEKGLQSHKYTRNNSLTENDISDNQVNDRRSRSEPIFDKSIHDYVPLYFNPKNPMLFVRKNIQNDILILSIDRKVLLRETTIFTNGNAASNPTKFYKNIRNLDKLNWECLKADYWNDFEDGKRLRCSEVLVYPEIPISAIKKIFSNNIQTNELVDTKLENHLKIEAEINTNLYFNFFKESNLTCDCNKFTQERIHNSQVFENEITKSSIYICNLKGFVEEQGYIRLIPRLKVNTNGHPFITFFDEDDNPENIYFSNDSTKKIGLKIGTELPEDFFMKKIFILTENEVGEFRWKINVR